MVDENAHSYSALVLVLNMYANDTTNRLVASVKKIYPVFDMLIENIQKSYWAP